MPYRISIVAYVQSFGCFLVFLNLSVSSSSLLAVSPVGYCWRGEVLGECPGWMSMRILVDRSLPSLWILSDVSGGVFSDRLLIFDPKCMQILTIKPDIHMIPLLLWIGTPASHILSSPSLLLPSFFFSDICVILFKTWSILVIRSFSWLSKDITSKTF